MSDDLVLSKLQAEREHRTRFGLCSTFNFLQQIFQSVEETKHFMIRRLSYKKWMVNKSHYLIKYHQKYYQQRKLNQPEIDKSN